MYLHTQNCLAWVFGSLAYNVHRTRIFRLLQVLDNLHWQSGDKNFVFHYFSASEYNVCANSAQWLGVSWAFVRFWGIFYWTCRKGVKWQMDYCFSDHFRSIVTKCVWGWAVDCLFIGLCGAVGPGNVLILPEFWQYRIWGTVVNLFMWYLSRRRSRICQDLVVLVHSMILWIVRANCQCSKSVHISKI